MVVAVLCCDCYCDSDDGKQVIRSSHTIVVCHTNNNDNNDNVQHTAHSAQAIMTGYAVGKIPSTWVFGKLSDKVGLRQCMCVSLAGFAVVLAMLGRQSTVPSLVVARIMLGIFGANGALLQVWVDELVRMHIYIYIFVYIRNNPSCTLLRSKLFG